MARQYVIINSEDVDNIDFSQVQETSVETLRWNKDNTKTFVKYEGYKPKFLYGKTAYSYSQIQVILNDHEGEWYIEDTTTDI